MGLRYPKILKRKNYIYDYASSNRDDALDIYLFSNKMVIAGTQGCFQEQSI